MSNIDKALLTELVKRRDFLRDKISDIEEKIGELRMSASPFKIGDVISARRRSTRQWEDAEVTDVQYRGFGTRDIYWYRVGWRRKDGTFGRQNERVFSDVRAKS